MPEEIKKILVAAVEGVDGKEALAAAQTGKMPNLKRLMGEGATVVGMPAGATTASSWASLATGAHAATHGVTSGEFCQAEYIWQAADRGSKRGLLLGYPASTMPGGADDHPQDLVSPSACNAAYFDRASAYLLANPDWDMTFVRVPASGGNPGETDDFIGKVLAAGDFETLSLVVLVPSGSGEALAVLAGPGVSAGKVVKRPAEIEDLTATLTYLGELPVPSDCEGGIIYQALEDPDAKIMELQACRRNYERLRRSSGRGPMC